MGPRVGFTYIGGETGEFLELHNEPRMVSQFGWQIERRYFKTSGLEGIVEIITLLNGIETDRPGLSGNILIGMRTDSGFEFGLGPNMSALGGPGFLYAFGYTAVIDKVHIPINFAVNPSRDGGAYTILVGMNIIK